MNEKKTGLEAFVERHRADFDAFEPRPDLWDAIELDLAASATTEDEAAPLRVLPLYESETAPTTQTVVTAAAATPDMAAIRSARPYGVAAAVAALLMVGGWFWQNHSDATRWTRTGQSAVVRTVSPTAAPDHSLYTGPSLTATPATAGPEQRLASTVQRMESYYATQIAERQQELRELDKATPAAAPTADWQQELTNLDSTYQQLRSELYRNPEPSVVLEAMDRNLQIRLDLLNQQLRTREQVRDYHTQPFIVADSRQTP
ncbi:hypothetical protein GCM10027346_23100 [Hymenobacter seoulensis]